MAQNCCRWIDYISALKFYDRKSSWKRLYFFFNKNYRWQMAGDFFCCRMHFKLHAIINSLWPAISVRVFHSLVFSHSCVCHFTYSCFHSLLSRLKKKKIFWQHSYPSLRLTYASRHFTTLLHLIYKTIHHFIPCFCFCFCLFMFVIVFAFNMIIL